MTDIEYKNANESYCHDCKQTIPNAHVRFHECGEDASPEVAE